MATKKTQSATNNTLKIQQDNEKSENRQLAEVGLSTTVLNATTSSNFTKGIVGEIDITEAVAVMKEKVSKVNAGDITGLEATLTAQATSLDTIFNALARRSIHSDTLTKLEVYMRLALKAQAQCARTIEVLSTMKNPPLVFAKQANISHGHQQVNNEAQPKLTQAEKTDKLHTQLLEVNNGSAKMDCGATQTTIPKDKAMAAMEAQHRCQNS